MSTWTAYGLRFCLSDVCFVCIWKLPVYKLVLLQVLAAPGDVSGHVEEVHHGQAGRLVLITQKGLFVDMSDFHTFGRPLAVPYHN